MTAYNWHQQHKGSLPLGDKAADAMRNGMGSWPFVFSFLSFMGAWASFNILAWTRHFDPYPFILLNLLLSTLAGLQGAILLIAAKRQDAISAALAQHDYEVNLQAEREIAFNNELTKEVHRLVEEIHGHIKRTESQSTGGSNEESQDCTEGPSEPEAQDSNQGWEGTETC